MLFCLTTMTLSAQQPTGSGINLDSIIRANSAPPAALPGSVGPSTTQLDSVKISEEALPDAIAYTARDSMKIDALQKKLFLYGGADITYTEINLKADFIEFDWGNNIVIASGLTDSLGSTTGKPVFTDGTETFNAGSIRYNFKTNKGIITDAASVQQNLYVQGKRTKFVSANGDTTKLDQIYNRNAIITTCDQDHPHYGLRSTKQKVVPGKVVVIGPTNVEVSDIPTPLWLPFGFVPISTGASTGLIFPRGYEFDPQWGFGLNNVGWFFPINDYLNATATMDFYVKGTFRFKARSNYRRRYRYTGNVAVGYDTYNNERNDGTRARDKAFSLRLTHRQDPKANPNRTFGGNINFQTNNALSKASNTVQAVETSTISSNFNYEEKFPGRPINLSVGLSHSQNTQTRQVTMTLPTANFRLTRIYPFTRKEAIGEKKWYEDIAVDYVGEARNRLVGSDTTFFSQETLDNAQYGARHRATASTKFRVFKYFNVTPNANYEEIWAFKTQERTFIPDFDTTMTVVNGIAKIDTTDLGMTQDTLVRGFEAFRKFNASVSMNTKLFGTMQFKKGKLRGIRHTLTPTIGFTYSPDQSQYFRTVRTDTFDEEEETEYNIFSGGVYNATPQRGTRASVNYGFGNLVEAKFFSKKDSTTRNVTLLRSLSVTGNYNFVADSLNFSVVSARTAARVFNGITNIAINATFDPYNQDEKGRRVQSFYYRTNGKPLRFDNLTTTFNSTLTVKKLREIFTGKRDKDDDPDAPDFDDLDGLDPNGLDLTDDRGNLDLDGLNQIPLTQEELEAQEKRRLEKIEEERKKAEEGLKEDFLSLFENFGINHSYRLRIERIGDRDTLTVQTHSLSVQGRIQLTERWSFTGLRIGYDFQNKQLTYPQIGVQRDLHCWVMGGSWQPSRGTFSFYLRVKPGSTLDFLNVPYNKTRPPRDVFR